MFMLICLIFLSIIIFLNKGAVESVRNAGSEVSFYDNLESFGVPHNELRLVRLPVVNGRHQIAIILIFRRIWAISLLIVKLTAGVSLSKACLFDNLILHLIKFDEAIKVDIVDLDFICR